MEKVKSSYVVPVYTDSSNVSSFTKQINVPFLADEVIVKDVSYFNTAGTGTPVMVSSDIIDRVEKRVMFMVSDKTGDHSWSNNRHIIDKPISGLYTFTMLGPDGNILATYSFKLAFLLEFVKY
jgi:CRISPR/Cas system CMR-associated protein Cmr3 (group 5 of RAMP superfamily)